MGASSTRNRLDPSRVQMGRRRGLVVVAHLDQGVRERHQRSDHGVELQRVDSLARIGERIGLTAGRRRARPCATYADYTGEAGCLDVAHGLDRSSQPDAAQLARDAHPPLLAPGQRESERPHEQDVAAQRDRRPRRAATSSGDDDVLRQDLDDPGHAKLRPRPARCSCASLAGQLEAGASRGKWRRTSVADSGCS